MSLLPLLLLACDDSPKPADTGDDGGGEDTDDTEVIGDTTDTGEDSGDSGDDTAEAAEEEARYAAFFDSATVQRVDLVLDETAAASLAADPYTFVSGTFIHDGTVVEQVGIRLKGSQSLDGKPGFKVKLNEFVPGRRYGTLERITLNNMVDDPTQSKEVVAWWAWAQTGMPAPQANFAQVYVNDEYYGLYANVETPDDHWLDRRYADGGGDLWDGNDSADFTAEGLDNFELVSGEGNTNALGLTFQAVWSADFWNEAGAYIDLPQYLDFWAWSIAIGTQEGYPYELDGYYLYADPADGLFDYTPWGLDEAWDTGMDPMYPSGAVAGNCLQDSVCASALDVAVEDALTLYETLDLAGAATAAHDLTEQAVADDTRRPEWTTSEVLSARNTLIYRMEQRPAQVRTQMGL